jgi:molybdopterin molybdotransferase
MSEANCFIVLAEECADVAAGEWVTVEPFAGLV